MRKNLLLILCNLQKTVTIFSKKNNIKSINYPRIYPYISESNVSNDEIYNDIFQLSSFLRHPHFYYMNRQKDGEPSKSIHYKLN